MTCVVKELNDSYAVIALVLSKTALQSVLCTALRTLPQTIRVSMTQDPTVRKTIVGLGEILWDIFPDAARFGGAPANFACSAAGLKSIPADICMLSAVGSDSLGNQAIQTLKDHGVRPETVQQNSRATGQVNVTIDKHGSASYEFAADAAWDNLQWSADLVNLAANADAVCWGTLGQRSQASKNVIRKFVTATKPECLRVLDINLRSPFWNESLLKDSLPMANVLKCNEDELPVLSSTFDMNGDDHSILLQLQQRFSLKLVALTRGAQDSILVRKSGTIHETETSQLPSVSTQVVDTVGAGDCFTAAIILGMLGNMKLTDLHHWACQVSAYVCSQAGATPTIPAELNQP